MLPARAAPPSPAAVQARAVAALRGALGLGAPTSPPGETYGIEVDGTDVELRAAPDGRHAVLLGRLGWLATEPRRAEAQLRELLRLGLALPMANRAGLCLIGSAEEGVAGRRARMADVALGRGRPAAVGAEALVAPERVGEALKDILHWAGLAATVLGRRPGTDGGAAAPQADARAAAAAGDMGGMMIFRP